MRDARLHETWIRVFDVLAHVRSDSPDLVRVLSSVYSHFVVDQSDVHRSTPLMVTVLTGDDHVWDRPVYVVDDAVWPLDKNGELHPLVVESIISRILTQVRSHILIHAAAVSREGAATVLAGDSGQGKTTLALALVQRGYRLLSDELAAFGVADRLVHPFPRLVHMRQASFNLLKLAHPALEGDAALPDMFLENEALHPERLGSPAPARQIVILANRRRRELIGTAPEEHELAIYVNRLDSELLAAVRQIEGVRHVWETVESGCPVIRLQARGRMQVLTEIDRMCDERRVLVLNVTKWSPEAQHFAERPELIPISPRQAVLELLRQFQPGHQSAVLDGGSSTQLFLTLASIVGQAQTYRLFPGPLDATVDLLCNLG